MSVPEPDIVTGIDLHEALEEAGLIPPNCGDLIIEVPLDGIVTIHEIRWAPRKLLEVIRAHVTPATVQRNSEEVLEASEDMTGKQWYERTRCPFDNEFLVPDPGTPILKDVTMWIAGKRCPKCLFRLPPRDK